MTTLLHNGVSVPETGVDGIERPHRPYFFISADWHATDRCRAIPSSFWQGGEGWCLPSDCDPDAARIALRLFPHLYASTPELAEIAAPQDIRPIDYATAQYVEPATPPYPRVLANARAKGIEPHSYQKIDAAYAVDRIQNLGGAYIGSEPGLGKSLMACMVAESNDDNFILVLCPNSAKRRTWLTTLETYMPWMNVVIVGNTAKQRAQSLEDARASIDAGTPTALVCHYEGLPLIDADLARMPNWDLLIADEAHRLKNTKTKFVKAALRVKACGTLLLSGSVLDGDIEDLYVPMKLMQPARYPAKWRCWNDRFVDWAEGGFGRISLGVKPHRLQQLREELGEVLVVRRAGDELDIPTAHVSDISLPMLAPQRKAYKDMVTDLFAKLPDGDVISATAGASLLSKLRQVTGGVALAEGKYSSAKLDYVEELLQDGGSAQSVVFTWHKELANRLAERLGDSATIVHGDISGPDREAAVEDFVRGRKRVLIATMATLSESVNLQCASRVILLEHSWRNLDNEQAVARVVRQGQAANAAVYNVTTTDTVDELRVLPVLRSKKVLREMVIGR